MQLGSNARQTALAWGPSPRSAFEPPRPPEVVLIVNSPDLLSAELWDRAIRMGHEHVLTRLLVIRYSMHGTVGVEPDSASDLHSRLFGHRVSAGCCAELARDELQLEKS